MTITQLPVQHLTIRVPWHDSGWDGTVCTRPEDNTSCQALSRIGSGKDVQQEKGCQGRLIAELSEEERPPCVGEKVRFMSDKEIQRELKHPYSHDDLYKCFKKTTLIEPAWSAACIPFRWMLREQVEGRKKEVGLEQRYGLDWKPEREPDLDWDGSDRWVQDKANQLASLDTFFGAVQPQESLCFFYAKRTPLSQDARRVIIGVGRVRSVGPYTEYKYKDRNPGIRCVLWERNVVHSIRPGFEDGFLFPYKEILDAVAKDSSIDPEEFVCFAPDDQFDSFSYGTEHLDHDGAISSLIRVAATLKRLVGVFDGPWKPALSWVDSELNRLWQARGPFPGLGSALAAFGHQYGYQYGTLLGYEIMALLEKGGADESPWAMFERVVVDPGSLPGIAARHIKPSFQQGWANLSEMRCELLELLSRFALSEAQALRFWDGIERNKAGIKTSDEALLENPWRLFEDDRRSGDALSFYIVDRGAFPDPAIREKYPFRLESPPDDPADPRRVRALTVQLLEESASEGHTLLPTAWLIERAREKNLNPPCPLGEDVVAGASSFFKPLVARQEMADGGDGWQLDWLVQSREIIGKEVRRRKGARRHQIEKNWRAEVDRSIGVDMPANEAARNVEEQARLEKSAALQELFEARFVVLAGSAGTGKTTLLKALLVMPEIEADGVLLLAPTGKARVRLEQQTGLRGHGKTIAQFLRNCGRYDTRTGRYSPNPTEPKVEGYATVVIDECSMLTEEQLAAVFESLKGVQRFIMVGDPRQLPPIGAGRAFVDIIDELQPVDHKTHFPRVFPNFAELTIPRRQAEGEDRDDVTLAAQFYGEELDAGSDMIWSTIASGQSDGTVEIIEWNDGDELKRRLLEKAVDELGLDGPSDEEGFALSIGGRKPEGYSAVFFNSAWKEHEGAAKKVSDWQILSPVHAHAYGVAGLNKFIQQTFRGRVQEMSEWQYNRKVPKPFGNEGILYGDKVINVVNAQRHKKSVWPAKKPPFFIANGDLGSVVGQYRTRRFNKAPKALEVEFAGQEGEKYKFNKHDFGEESQAPLELAYALTVHKTQGSEFGVTFVVVPNPCWLLSRELLYTALTRQQHKIILFHQGPFNDLRNFMGDEHSQIKQRVTNLFRAPSPHEIKLIKRSVFLEEGLIHRTERGELVRSKSELVIADKLHSHDLDYGYESELILPDGKRFRPDFSIEDDATGVTWVWEHLGLLHRPEYRRRWEKKRRAYIAAGIVPWGEGEGDKYLLETRDDERGGLDSSEITRLINEVILA